MKSFPIAVLAFALGLPLASHAHDTKHHAAPTAAATADLATRPVVAVVEQFSQALQAANYAKIGELLAPDVLILESGGAERSREEYLGHHAIADAQFLKDAHVQVLQRTARIDGGLAWVGTESELRTQKDGKPLTLLSTETMVLKKLPSGWRIVHIHWSSRTKKDTAAIPTP